MNANLKVVSTTTDPIDDIVSQIEDGTWKYVKKDFDLLQFVTLTGPGKYVINDRLQLQCRDKSLSYDFADRQVAKVNETGDKSELKKPVLVYFPNSIEYDGVRFAANSYGLVDDAHGTLIKVRLNIFNYDCYYINFDLHLDSKKSNIRAIGNMLNRQWSEKQSVTRDHLKTEYHVLIDEAIADGLPDGVPTEEQNDRFLARYAKTTGITRKSLGQFKSSHDKIGGRSKKAIKEYSPEMKQEVMDDLADSPEYKDQGYVILYPRSVGAYDGEALGHAVKMMTKEKKDKAVIPLYVTGETQAVGIETDTGDWSKIRLQDFANDYGEFMGGKEIKLIFMDPR
tara:strand:- start:1695 stop:2711 length:1017 start_codon:yes stop_codon:yes gene_type:complete